MRKRKLTPLTLNKKSISSLKSTHILGGKDTIYYFSLPPVCKSKVCVSQFYQDCTVTYETCVTELRFCGAF